MSWRDIPLRRPRVLLLGSTGDVSFGESLALVCSTAAIVTSSDERPDVVVVCQRRPGEIRGREIETLQRHQPLAGFVSLLGSWCEGETRTGRPWPGVTRFYWYEFPQWWRRQLERFEAGLCPDWARPAASDVAVTSIRNPQSAIRNRHGLVVLSTEYGSTAETIGDVLTSAGFAIVHQLRGKLHPFVRGAAAAIWEGGQLDDAEVAELRRFCLRFQRDGTRVVVLADFPRCDRMERAREAGAAVVLGKPWRNVDLVGALVDATSDRRWSRAA